jgi:hypothetical protein
MAGLDETATVSLRLRGKKLRDNIGDHVPVFAAFEEEGVVTKGSGGRTIVREFDYVQNPNFKRFHGGENLPIGGFEFASAAEQEWSQFAASYTITGREVLMNSGAGQSIDILPAKMKNMERTIKNYLDYDLISDGTADSGKQLKGLLAQIKKIPNATGAVLGGIAQDAAANAFYRNYAFNTVSTGGAALSIANALRYVRKCVNATTRLNDKTKFILAGTTYYEILQEVAQSFQQGQVPVKGKLFDLGFSNVAIDGIPVMHCGGVNFSGLSQVQADLAYGINPSGLELVTHKDCFITPLEKRFSTNQDVEVRIMAGMWCMIAYILKTQWVMFDS